MDERFWKSVEKTNGCWFWTGYRNPAGYGRLTRFGRTLGAHRYSWMISRGDPGPLDVLHKCDQRNCVRPDHLFLGTQADNVRDMDEKGRRRVLRGERHGRSVISDREVDQLRRLFDGGGYSLRALAKAYGVSRTQTRSILKNESRRGE